MYRLNPLNREVLITTDEVIAMAPVDINPEIRQLLSAVIIAEERFITELIGYEFYEELITLKNKIVTDDNRADLEIKVNAGNNGPQIVLVNGQMINAIEFVEDEWFKKLWNRYLWKITAECVAYVAIPTNSVRTTSAGEMKNNPVTPLGVQGAASAERGDVRFKMDKVLQDRIDPLIEACRRWMSVNKSHFPSWDSENCDLYDGTSFKRKTPFVHGCYDDDSGTAKNPNCSEGIYLQDNNQIIISEN